MIARESDFANDVKAKAKKRALCVEVVREVLSYDPHTGEFRWKARPPKYFKAERDCSAWNGRYANTIAGNTAQHGYRALCLFHTLHYAHRLAWAIHYGVWPKNQIDHINHDRTDNRISNLREVTCLENMKNQARVKRNTSGVTGVSHGPRAGTWRAFIRHNYRNITIGVFDSFDEAVSARKTAETRMGFHPNHGNTKQGDDDNG